MSDTVDLRRTIGEIPGIDGRRGLVTARVSFVMRRIRSVWLFGLLALASAVLLPGCLAMEYLPAGLHVGPPPAGVQVVCFPSSDGVTVKGWLYQPRSERPGERAHAGKEPGMADASEDGLVRPIHPGHLVVFCHGVQDTAASGMCEFLVKSGFRVLTFDYRGFGDSSRAAMSNLGFSDDAYAALEFGRRLPGVDPKRVFVVGHSMGGVYALAAASRAAEAGRPVAGVVSGSAFSNWRQISNRFLPVLGLLAGGVTGPEPTFWAARLGQTHLLVVHAANDRDVPSSHSLTLAGVAIEAGTPTEVYLCERGGHVRAFVLRDKNDDEFDWVYGDSGPGASGAAAVHVVSWIQRRLRVIGELEAGKDKLREPKQLEVPAVPPAKP